MFDIPALDDPRILVTITVPVKGRKAPLVLKLPRFDFIDEDQHDAIADATKAGDDEQLPLRKRQRLADLSMLKPFVPAKDYAACEALSSGQLQAVMLNWATSSSIPLGEFLASATSSGGNTEAQSSSTSTTPDGPDSTSEDG